MILWMASVSKSNIVLGGGGGGGTDRGLGIANL
jgi:hypothetical protein